MANLRTRLLYGVLVPAVLVAAGVIGYFAWRTTQAMERLGEESIVESTLLLAREKIDRLESVIIAADNAVLHLYENGTEETLGERWLPIATRVTPSIRAVAIVDENGSIAASWVRADESQARDFRKLLIERMLPDLELDRLRDGRLRHFVHDYAGQTYLLAFRASTSRELGRRYVIMHHDVGHIVRDVFPQLFEDVAEKRLLNVVDDHGRVVYGRSLDGAGDFLVGRRFPTTLYTWRMQVVPKQGPLLGATARTRRANEIVLIGLSFSVVLVGIGVLLFASAQERRLNALKSDFVANVTHELKTPLSVIRMFGDLLVANRVKSDEKRLEYLRIICRESERLSALIDNVLDFERVERGKATYRIQDGEIGDVAARALETFQHRFEREGVKATLVVAEDIGLVPFDEQAVLLAIVNLLDNAAKYGGGGEVELRVERHQGMVQIVVRDHGSGIPALERKRVFDRFYRGKSHSNVRGSGIGLALVRRIAEVHGGRAWIEDAPGGGVRSCFSLVAPLRSLARRSRESSAPRVSSPDGTLLPDPPLGGGPAT